ncbi:DapH/DapD/GlmU-related protein [Neisseria chenwenguii]|uniref:Acetyltransferase n=1 Tax=Neisseria chenwenguii TaxID=1853278 RepID=A0A220RZJ3_9NEIS|nr:DapH/DapD/GlmU-related protein [Neisseria chenwenguii]ASK26572.1 acetyltransferase [Neisseria chenwenguii]ROV54412.1 sugar O-acetyltransferase [Neisseria chenwenguii]
MLPRTTRDVMADCALDLPLNSLIAHDSVLFEQIHQIVAENAPWVAKLNTGFHTPAQTQALLETITASPIDSSVRINLPFYTDFGRHIRIGKNVFINTGVMFTDLGGIILEDNVLIGPRANIISVNHPLDAASRRGVIVRPVVIKKNAWIGAGATVLAGVTVGENAVVAAGAVVSKDVPPDSVVGGVPAKILKKIK